MIKELLANGYSEEEIALKFDKTISEVRRELPAPTPLTKAAWTEACVLYPTAHQKRLAQLYNTTVRQISLWSRNKAKEQSIRPTQQVIEETLYRLGNKEDTAKELGIPVYLVKFSKKAMPSIEELQKAKGTHEDIALAFGVSRTWVTKVLSKKHKASSPNKIKDWEPILEALKTNSLKHTANMFGITPSAIIHWRKRNGR